MIVILSRRFRRLVGATVGMVVLTLGVTLAGPAPSASAGPGEWDWLGSRYTEWSDTLDTYRTDYVYSHGGYFKYCVSKTGLYYLYEYDPDNADDLAASDSLDAGDCAINYATPFVDGSNDKAEFYIRTSIGHAYVTFYD